MFILHVKTSSAEVIMEIIRKIVMMQEKKVNKVKNKKNQEPH